MTQPILKGASRLRLDLHELRFQLIQADIIIAEAYGLLDVEAQSELKAKLVYHTTSPYDPLFSQHRTDAIQRITPKCDYLTIALIMAVVALGIAWSCSQTENELLQAEAGIAQSHTLQGEPYGH